MSLDSQLNNLIKFGKFRNASMRQVVLKVSFKTASGFSFLTWDNAKNIIANALRNDGFIISNIDVDSWAFSSAFLITCQVLPQYTDEQVRLRAQEIILNIDAANDYFLFKGASGKLFTSVNAQLVQGVNTAINANDLGVTVDSLLGKNTGLGLGQGLGVSLPIVAILAVLGVIIIKKI